jgi:hypothetical protein
MEMSHTKVSQNKRASNTVFSTDDRVDKSDILLNGRSRNVVTPYQSLTTLISSH